MLVSEININRACRVQPCLPRPNPVILMMASVRGFDVFRDFKEELDSDHLSLTR